MDHLNKERDQMHVVLGASTLGVSREGVFVGKAFHKHLEIVLEHLNSVWVALTDRLVQDLEVPIDHLTIRVDIEASSSKREEVIALCVIVPDGSTLPFFLGLSELRVCSVGILMAGEMDVVRVSDCGVSLSVCEASAARRDLTDLELLREDIHAEDICWFLGVSFLAHDALRASLLLESWVVELSHKLVGILLGIHRLHDFLSLSRSQLLLFIVLLGDQPLQVISNLRIILLILVG